MATLRIKRKLAALNKENCEEQPRINLTQTSERMRTTPKVILFLKRGSLRARLCKNLAQVAATKLIVFIQFIILSMDVATGFFLKRD